MRGNFGCGVPKSPFVRSEVYWGEGVTFAARRGRELVHLAHDLGPNTRVFSLWLKDQNSLLVIRSPRGPRVPMAWGGWVGVTDPGYPIMMGLGS